MFKLVALLAAASSVSGPRIEVYKSVSDIKLTAHIFRPVAAGRRRPVIVLFHGGGWTAGSPEWVYDAAKRYASLGAVAIAAEYRLSDQKTLTPLDAMADARDIVRWMRRNAANLGIDTARVAAYGVSAGGQLAASLAVLDDRSGANPALCPMPWC